MEPRHPRNCANNSGTHEADTSNQRETKRTAYTVELTPHPHTSWAVLCPLFVSDTGMRPPQ